jgi:hypothetical protein
MPFPRFAGDNDGSSFLGAGSSGNFALRAVILALVSNFLAALLRSSGAGVPKRACLNALTANWWAGVSGGSMKVDSYAGSVWVVRATQDVLRVQVACLLANPQSRL